MLHHCHLLFGLLFRSQTKGVQGLVSNNRAARSHGRSEHHFPFTIALNRSLTSSSLPTSPALHFGLFKMSLNDTSEENKVALPTTPIQSTTPTTESPRSILTSPDRPRRSSGRRVSFANLDSNNKNRNSMPVTRRENRQGFSDLASALGGVDTTTFLFGSSEDDPPRQPKSRPTSGILHMSKNNDDFPVLLRSDITSAPMSLTASSDALEQNYNQQNNDSHDDGGWPAEFAPQSTRASMPPAPSHAGNYLCSEPPTLPGLASAGFDRNSLPKNDDSISAANRHSMGARMTFTETKRPALLPTPMASGSSSRVPTKLQTSFSTSSVPTVGSLANGNSSNGNGTVTPTTTSSNMSAEQRFHNHNASLGRIPPGASNNRHSRDLSTILDKVEPEPTMSPPSASVLHAQAAAFGPSAGFGFNKGSESFTPSAITSPAGGVALNLQSPISNSAGLSSMYGFNTMPNISASNNQNKQMQTLGAALNGSNLNEQPGQTQFAQSGQPQFSQFQNYQQQFPNAFASFQPFTPGQGVRTQDSQVRVIQQRRAQAGEGMWQEYETGEYD